ncbi:MAG: hypothetical protein ACI4T1_01205 [Christensenellales bacterium]
MDIKFNGFANNVIKDGDQYSYFFDGEILHLNRIKEVSGVEYSFINKQISVLQTTKHDGGNVVLFDCIERCMGLSNDELEIKPSYIFESKYQNYQFDKFSGIVCYGKWINKLFPPSQIVEYDSLNYEHNKETFYQCARDGSKTIKLKKWDDVDKKFKYKVNSEEIEISFNISSPGTIREEDENLGEIKSLFELKLSNSHNITEVKDYYLIIRKFFQFLTNRQDILFDEIHILQSCEVGKYERIGCFYDLNNKSSEIPKKMHLAKHYFGNITKLFKYISNEKINFNHIPKNNLEHRYVTPEQYVNCCGSFEYNYKKVFKDEPLDEKTNQIINDLSKFLESQSNYNSKQRKIIKKIIDDLNKTSQSVEKKYNKCLKRYKDVVSPFINELINHYEIAKTPQLLGSHFSSYRNHKAHGELTPFTKEAVCAYVVANVIIECLILDACGFSIEEMKEIVKNKY